MDGPAWSPDGRFIAFLRAVPACGELARRACSHSAEGRPRTGAWRSGYAAECGDLPVVRTSPGPRTRSGSSVQMRSRTAISPPVFFFQLKREKSDD